MQKCIEINDKKATTYMSVYVDNWNARFRGMIMCHMIADTHDELIAMVRKIDVKIKWLQSAGTYREHFDICLNKRRLAIHHGAIEVTQKELVIRMLAKR